MRDIIFVHYMIHITRNQLHCLVIIIIPLVHYVFYSYVIISDRMSIESQCDLNKILTLIAIKFGKFRHEYRNSPRSLKLQSAFHQLSITLPLTFLHTTYSARFSLIVFVFAKNLPFAVLFSYISQYLLFNRNMCNLQQHCQFYLSYTY